MLAQENIEQIYIKDTFLPSLQNWSKFNANMIFAIHLQIICSREYICVYIIFTNSANLVQI